MKVIIFDFDGTIADSFDAVLGITNRLAKEFGYAPAGPEEVKRFKNLNSREIIKQSKIPVYRLPFLLRRLKTEMSQEVAKLKPIPGMREALIQLKQQGHKLGIVTSNGSENVVAFLQANQMAGLFDFIQSGIALFGKGRAISRVVRQFHLDANAVVYVGDETRDIEAAQKVQIKAIAVSWGFNSNQALAEQCPDFLIHEPWELVEAIAKLTSP